ncbi:MAG: hypothetical protein JXB36_16470 [Gammaproteobacteria bacterium]|nr:hypothetical protein [Gammaproteobacteria bacterium]
MIVAAFAAVTAIVIYALVLVRRRRGSVASRQGSAPNEAPANAALDAVRSVRFLRDIGFFADDPESPDDELARRLEQRIEDEWGAPLAELARTSPQLDVLIALQDERRSYRAPDEYFYPGEDSFLEIVERCGALEGLPRYTPLAEEWTSTDGPVEVRFSVEGRESAHTVRDPKYIDPGLFGSLNAAASGGSRRLRVSDALGMPNVVLALTDSETEALVSHRGWVFHPAAD